MIHLIKDAFLPMNMHRTVMANDRIGVYLRVETNRTASSICMQTEQDFPKQSWSLCEII